MAIQMDTKNCPGMIICLWFSVMENTMEGAIIHARKQKLDDGWIDGCLISPVSRRQILTLAQLYHKGQHTNLPIWFLYFVQRLYILIPTIKIFLWNLDGEVRKMKNPTLEICENHIHLLLPNIGESVWNQI